MIVFADTREPGPSHPWERYLPSGWSLERVCLPPSFLKLSAAGLSPGERSRKRKARRSLAQILHHFDRVITRKYKCLILKLNRRFELQTSYTHPTQPQHFTKDKRVAFSGNRLTLPRNTHTYANYGNIG